MERISHDRYSNAEESQSITRCANGTELAISLEHSMTDTDLSRGTDKSDATPDTITCKTCGRKNVPDWNGQGQCISCARDAVLGTHRVKQEDSSPLSSQEVISRVADQLDRDTAMLRERREKSRANETAVSMPGVGIFKGGVVRPVAPTVFLATPDDEEAGDATDA